MKYTEINLIYISSLFNIRLKASPFYRIDYVSISGYKYNESIIKMKMCSIILILTGFLLFSCSVQAASASKSGSYTSYVKQYQDKDSACNSTCRALRLGIGIGISSLVVSCVCIPLTTWYCVYKCKQINFGFFKRRGRHGDYELVNQKADGTIMSGDSSSDLEVFDD